MSVASEPQLQHWPSEPFHECEGRNFSQPDLRFGDWSSYLIAVTGELADAEEDVLWPNQASVPIITYHLGPDSCARRCE